MSDYNLLKKSDSDSALKTALVWTLAIGAGSAVAWGLSKAGKGVIDEIRQTGTENKVGTDKAATWAADLQAAMDGPGTDNDAVIRVLTEIATKANWERVQRQYRNLTKSSLTTDLKEELTNWGWGQLWSGSSYWDKALVIIRKYK